MTKKKALIAMSGGVDSSVAAYLTQKAGYEIMGVNMHLFDGNRRNQDNEKSCCSVKDTLCANSVAERLGFPFHVWDYTAQFKERVINNFIKAYETGKKLGMKVYLGADISSSAPFMTEQSSWEWTV